MQKVLTAEERHEILIKHGWQYLLSTEEGRALVYHLIGKCGVYRSDTIQNEFIQFEAGKRSIGLFILSEAEATDPEAFVKMIQEYVNRNKEISHEEKISTEPSE